MKQKDSLTDEELALLAAGGDKDAEELLICRFSGFVYEQARPYFLPGADHRDILQEGLIGLWEAINAYDGEKCPSFSSFAAVCVKRQILSAVKNYNRQKHIPLNGYLSLYAPVGEGENATLMAALPDEAEPGLEEAYISREELSRLEREIEAILTPLEKKIFFLYLEGASHWSIARQLGKSTKSVDSTIQRARRKLRQALWEDE